MKKIGQGVVVVVLAAVFAVALTALLDSNRKAQARPDETKIGGGPRYSVIETQGFNLLVTDNASNTLYYYATDKDVPVGSPLKLRASLDLTKVGQKELNIKPHNLEKMRKKEKAKD